jgi:hypothetical protein
VLPVWSNSNALVVHRLWGLLPEDPRRLADERDQSHESSVERKAMKLERKAMKLDEAVLWLMGQRGKLTIRRIREGRIW